MYELLNVLPSCNFAFFIFAAVFFATDWKELNLAQTAY